MQPEMRFLFCSMQHVQKYGSAFLNSDGGVLMAGILDNGETGVHLLKNSLQSQRKCI